MSGDDVAERPRTAIPGQRGAVALEDLGMLPIVLVVVLAGWQILVVGVSESCSAVRLRRRHGSMQ